MGVRISPLTLPLAAFVWQLCRKLWTRGSVEHIVWVSAGLLTKTNKG